MPTLVREDCPLTIQLFGPMEVRCGAQLLPKVRSRKALWALALLALRANRPVSREWLAATIWPDSDTPRETLRRTLTDLRTALGECSCCMESTGSSITLHVPETNVDVLAFDACVQEASPTSLRQAIALYRGPLLEECLEVWIDAERRTRAEAYVQSLQSAARLHLNGGGDAAQARSYLRSAIQADPFREAVYRDLMQSLAESGDVAEAVQVFRSLRLLLHTETRIEPSQETTALYHTLLADARQRATDTDRAAARSSTTPLDAQTTHLPRPLTDLIGREVEMQQIQDRLAHSRLVTVTGIGGLGKTRLAVEVGLCLQRDLDASVCFVDLAAVAEPEGVDRAVASALGVREEAGRTLDVSICDALRNRRLLLIIDNCEHILDGAAHLIRAVVSRCPHIRVLATSRQSLGLTGEQVLRLSPLGLPRREDAASISDAGHGADIVPAPALCLFAERAAAVLPGFAVTPQNVGIVTEICRRLDGIPLALELAAARVNRLSLEQIACRLEDRFRLLTRGDRAAPPRQQTLRALLDWSYDLLDPPARRLFARLSVFAGGWTLEAADEVCGDPGSEPPLFELMSDLVEKSLILAEQGPDGDMRYRMLETLRQYATEALEQFGEAAQLRRRHLLWCLRFAEAAEPHIRGPRQAALLREEMRERDNLRQALEEAGPGPERMRLAAALFWHWYIHGMYAEGRSWLDRTLRETPDAPIKLRCKATKAAGDLCWALGNMEEARQIHTRNLEVQRAAGDRHGEGQSLNSLGLVHYHQGDCAGAAACYRQSLALLREAGDRIMTGVVLMNLALPMKEQGDYAGAEALLAEADAVHRETGNCQGLGAVLHSRCLIAKRLGDYVRARSFIEEAIEIDRSLQNLHGEGVNLHTMGEIAFYLEDLNSAEQCYTEALERFRAIGARRFVAAALCSLGEVCAARGDLVQARSFHLESLEMEAALDNRIGIINSLRCIADLELISGSPQRAARLLAAGEVESERLGVPLPPNQRTSYEKLIAAVRTALGETAYAAEWRLGRAMTLEDAIVYSGML